MFNSTRVKSAHGKSFVISPHNTFRTLLLAYFGAEGDTKNRLEDGTFLLDWSWRVKKYVIDAFEVEWKTRAVGYNSYMVTFDSFFVSDEVLLR